MIRFFLSNIFLFFSFTTLLAQTTKDTGGIDNMVVSYRNLQNFDELSPPSVTDTAINSQKIEMSINFSVSNPALLKEIDLKVGKQEAKSEFRSNKYKLVKEGTDFFFTSGNKIYPIKNGVVHIIDQVPVSALQQNAVVSLVPTKSDGSILSPITKKGL